MKNKSTIEELFSLHCKALGLRPEREFQFHPTRRWRFDFAFPDRMCAVECEGAVWTNGRHTRGSGFVADCEKYAQATLLGWRVLRFTSDMVASGVGINLTKQLLIKVDEWRANGLGG